MHPAVEPDGERPVGLKQGLEARQGRVAVHQREHQRADDQVGGRKREFGGQLLACRDLVREL